MLQSARTMYAVAETKWNSLSQTAHLVTFLMLLNLTDFCLTTFLISVYGYEVEANMWLRDLMIKYDTVYMLLLPKVAFMVALVMTFHRITDDHKLITPRRLEKVLVVVSLFYVGVIVWSVYLVGRTPVVSNWILG